METLLREALPETPDASRRRAADLVEATLTEVGQRFSEQVRTPAEIEAYADALADIAELGEICPALTSRTRCRAFDAGGKNPRWCTNRPTVVFPLSVWVSADPGGDWHAETGHPVEHIAPDFCLGPLIG
jgi:hypothetical protein